MPRLMKTSGRDTCVNARKAQRRRHITGRRKKCCILHRQCIINTRQIRSQILKELFSFRRINRARDLAPFRACFHLGCASPPKASPRRSNVESPASIAVCLNAVHAFTLHGPVPQRPVQHWLANPNFPIVPCIHFVDQA